PNSRDLFGVFMGPNTGSGRTELHILSASSNYTQFTAHIATALGMTNGNQWQFAVAPNRDLFCIFMNRTGSGMTEVHVLSAASGYQQFVGHWATALGATYPKQAQFQVDGHRNLVLILMNTTGSGRTEVHVLSADSGYQQ